MSLAIIRTEIKTVLEGVSGIGMVYDYIRHAPKESIWKVLFTTSLNRLHTWQITRTGVKDDWLTTCENGIRRHSFQVLGYYSLKDDDASENTFQDLTDSVMTALRNAAKSPPLSGTALNMTTPQAEIYHKDYYKVLTHACCIKFTVDEYILPS